jgi:uncharacterized membrane protein YfcA
VSFFPLLVGGVIGALLGSLLGSGIPTSALRVLIGVMTLMIGIITLTRRNGVRTEGSPHPEPVKWRQRRVILFSIGLVAGTAAGAFGAGWGTIGVALLVWTGIPAHTVVGSALLARSGVAITAAGSYALQTGSVPASVFFPLLLAGGVGVILGVRTSNGFGPDGMRRLLGGVITAVGILAIIKVLL